MENLLQDAISQLAGGGYAVAVGDEETPAVDRGIKRIEDRPDAHLISQEIAHPVIVITGDIGDFAPGVNHGLKTSQDPEGMARHDREVLEPEVKQVSDDAELSARVPDVVEETVEHRDRGLLDLRIRPQMKVRQKIYLACRLPSLQYNLPADFAPKQSADNIPNGPGEGKKTIDTF
jgi:hypothetical protein